MWMGRARNGDFSTVSTNTYITARISVMGWTSAGTIVYTLVVIALFLGSCTFALPVLGDFLLPDILIAELSNKANLVFSKAKLQKYSPNIQSRHPIPSRTEVILMSSKKSNCFYVHSKPRPISNTTTPESKYTTQDISTADQTPQ